MSGRYTGVLPLDHTLPKVDRPTGTAAPVDVLEVMRKSANAARINARNHGGEVLTQFAEDSEAAREAVAAMIEALDGIEQAYCRAGEQLTRDERTEDRKRLIAARSALASAKGGSA